MMNHKETLNYLRRIRRHEIFDELVIIGSSRYLGHGYCGYTEEELRVNQEKHKERKEKQ